MRSMSKRSAGLLMYRIRDRHLNVFVLHPGGPYWSKKSEGSWTIPKGEYDSSEEPLEAAIREFREETGFEVAGPFLELGSMRQKSGKVIVAWAFEGDCDPAGLVSNTCEIEWPPHSGKRIEIPEIDRGEWFRLDRARESIRAEQIPLLETVKSLVPNFTK